MRWQIRPGAELYVVWTQSRHLNRDDPFFFRASRVERRLASLPNQLTDPFGLFPANALLVKLNYTLLW